jgi:hypothetical protein
VHFIVAAFVDENLGLTSEVLADRGFSASSPHNDLTVVDQVVTALREIDQRVA